MYGRSQKSKLWPHSNHTCAPFQVEERVPVVKRANEAVEAAAEKIRQLKLELFERGVKIEFLNRQLATAEVEVDQTRDRATKLEERFTQVGNEDALTVSWSIPQPHLRCFSSVQHEPYSSSNPCLSQRPRQAVEERVDEVKLPLEDELAVAYAGRQEEKALRESDRR